MRFRVWRSCMAPCFVLKWLYGEAQDSFPKGVCDSRPAKERQRFFKSKILIFVWALVLLLGSQINGEEVRNDLPLMLKGEEPKQTFDQIDCCGLCKALHWKVVFLWMDSGVKLEERGFCFFVDEQVPYFLLPGVFAGSGDIVTWDQMACAQSVWKKVFMVAGYYCWAI